MPSLKDSKSLSDLIVLGLNFSLSFSVVLAPAIVGNVFSTKYVWSITWQFQLQLGFEVKVSP
jgi:hypothetical protein